MRLMPYYAETGRSRPLIAWLYGYCVSSYDFEEVKDLINKTCRWNVIYVIPKAKSI
jgi:hypothetical protein